MFVSCQNLMIRRKRKEYSTLDQILIGVKRGKGPKSSQGVQLLSGVRNKKVNMSLEVEQVCRFFDDLANRVPPRFYFQQEEMINMSGMKKKEKLKLQKEFKKLKLKQNKLKQDPDNAKTTLQLQKEELLAATQLKEKGYDVNDQNQGSFEGAKINVESNVDREDLKRRLNERLEGFKSARKATDDQKQINANQAKDFKNKQRQKSAEKLKRRRKQQEQNDDGASNLNDDQNDEKNDGQIQFGKVDLGHADQVAEDQHPKKKGKVRIKEDLLKEIKSKKEHLQTIRNTGEEQELLNKEGWEASLRRAQGEKVYDDPKLLKRSLKAMKKKKEKSAQAWNQRLKTQKQQMDAKQNRRTENINKKIEGKKQKRVQKRENRLMRAGFEGRREEFIKGGQ
eukprot:TRINITY_DN17813_c0_g1_i5.p2 TRINITY_DN17813_c0_g1~~TRINITY_DN17813_c0_g1_i5.p2  ORF type:complete len:394 (+),score=75.11 TRINITY_DN17813_c0_g1_i5:1246-2427(+)